MAASTSGGPGQSLRQRVVRLAANGMVLWLLLAGLVAFVSPLLLWRPAPPLAASRAGQVAVADLLLGVADQESGLRAFAATRQPGDLKPYEDGRAHETRALAELQQLTAGTTRARELGLVAADAANWQRWADGVRQDAAAGAGADALGLSAGEPLLTRLRADSGALRVALDRDASAVQAAATRGSLGLVAWAGGGAVALGMLLALLAVRAAGLALDPVRQLAATASQIAAGERPTVPPVRGDREVQRLAGAMRAWSAAAGERAALAQQAPVGICRFDARGALASVNEAMSTMLGLERRELIGRSYVQLVHPTEVERQRQMLRRLESGAADRLTLEVRCLRADGSTLWCAAYLGAVHDGGGRPDGMLAIMEDISHRREQRERAARIQRSLLPAEVPPLAGYDLAAICQPEDDVGGDFYDWVLARDGHLDLTVADVMGKGIGAALVTATLRAAMRTAPAELGPGERLRRASAAMGLGGEEEGVFVTVFHGRLDLATGELRYVDAGHGYVAIRTAGGDLVSLPERCLPIGVGQEFPEGRVTLAPGDMLVVHSDGLVEREDRTASLSEFAADLDAARDAADAVARLQRTLSGRLADDVTVMALRRAASRPPAA